MKIGKKSEKRVSTVKPKANSQKKNMLLVVVIAITALLIIWVYAMGRKAEQTVDVVMMAENAYKNEAITENMLKSYPMLKGEFEKYATTDEDGALKRRILLWDERDMILGAFAAYPLQADTVAMYDNFYLSRIDNSDSVLYSFPGKNIVSLEAGEQDLEAFKTYLQPGDRINVTAIFKDQATVETTDDTGVATGTTELVDTFREETVFNDIMLADLLNSSGQSILDLYEEYNNMTTYEQANMDASETWIESVTPSTVLIALTPEEEIMYYKYLSKDSVTFKISLPQRSN